MVIASKQKKHTIRMNNPAPSKPPFKKITKKLIKVNNAEIDKNKMFFKIPFF